MGKEMVLSFPDEEEYIDIYIYISEDDADNK